MTLVDGKGRLFGRINLLDLVVVLAVVAVAGRYGYKHLMPQRATTSAQDKIVEITFKVPKVTQPTIDAIRIGDEVVESATNTPIGTVTKVEPKPALVSGESGEYTSQYYSDLYVTISGPGRIAANGAVSMSNIQMFTGAQTFLRTARWKGNGYALDLPKAQ